LSEYGYEQLVYFYDKPTGLKAITCIHNTVLGPSLGGTRFWNYATEEEATTDVLRLARGMTYKSACAGLNLGGGKSVVIGDPDELKNDIVRREAFFRAFGRFIEGLGGRYITAEDVNTTTADMAYINMETDYVCGLENKSGNPSPFTALGVYKAMRAAGEAAFGKEGGLKKRKVAVQGVGEVGKNLCKLLKADGAELYITDINAEKVEKLAKELGATAVDKDKIFDVDCDIFAPCALGGVINDETLGRLKCKVITGAANNVLLDPEKHGKAIHDKGIIYAPDYVANAGGIINVYEELHGYNEDNVRRSIEHIYDLTAEIIRTSQEKNIPTGQVADAMAEARINAIRNVNSIYLG
ncbi:MAG: leucine dehydrogenase, partial [Clostridiales bacterium]|nr:leucine dehydrogenase [Clostridiales bacterium]